MRILVYCNNENESNSLYQMIKLLPIQTIVDVVTTYEDSINLYSQYEYKKVFIDYMDEQAKDLEYHIMEINPNQIIILLNEDYECLDTQKCIECQNNFNKYVVIKPLNVLQLPKIINNNFICEGFCKTAFGYNLEKIKKIVKNKYPTIKYDEENKKFDFDFIPKPFIVELFVELTTLLANYNIEYSINENKSIQIHY